MARGLLLYFAIFAFTHSAPSAGTTKVRRYEYGAPINLAGVIGTRVHPGPPNYENVQSGDVAEEIWLLKLRTPIALKDDGDPTSNNEAEKDIREVQLVILSPKDERLMEKYIGHSVRLTGTLFHALTGHHHVKILMDVKKWAAMK